MKNVLKMLMVFLAIGAFVALSSVPAFCENGTGSAIAGDDEAYTSPGDTERDPGLEYGTVNFISYTAPSHEFTGWNSTYDNYIQQSVGTRYCSSSCILDAGIHIPNGARIWGLELDYVDSAGGSITLNVDRCAYNATGCNVLGSVSSVGSGGVGFVENTTLNHTVDNYNNSYIFEAFLDAGSSYRIIQTRVMYYLQISPAPASASFNDVPVGAQFFQYIEALARSGITVGCGGGNFCPDQAVTRGQMAAFLSRALGLHWPG